MSPTEAVQQCIRHKCRWSSAHPLCKAAAASRPVIELVFLDVEGACVPVWRRLGRSAAHLCRSFWCDTPIDPQYQLVHANTCIDVEQNYIVIQNVGSSSHRAIIYAAELLPLDGCVVTPNDIVAQACKFITIRRTFLMAVSISWSITTPTMPNLCQCSRWQ